MASTPSEKSAAKREDATPARPGVPGGPALSRRAALRLAGIGLGSLVAAAGGVARSESYPALDAPAGRALDYAPNKGKFAAPELMVASRLVDSIPVFGSSELVTLPTDVPQVPRGLLGTHDYGLDFWCVGDAGYMSLWHAIALGAYAGPMVSSLAPSGELAAGVFDARASNKVVLIVSPQWFYPGGAWRDAVTSHFSFRLWRAFCQSPNVTPAQVEYCRGRLLERGVDALSVRAGCDDTLPDLANAVALGFKEEHETRAQIRYVLRDRPDIIVDKADVQAADGAPDWDALLAEAAEQAREETTSNDFGFLDSFWNEHLANDFAAGKYKDSQKSDNLLMAPTEDKDLALALDVARQGGLDVLCVLLPWSGPWEDYRGLSKTQRDRRNETLRSIVTSHGARLADFSERAYEPYFVYDGTHPGWVGWLEIERAVYEFAMGE